MSDEKLRELLEEIRAAREQNTVEHERVLSNVKESAELAMKIESIIDRWSNFWSIIMGIRNVVFTISFVIVMAHFISEWASKLS